MGELKERFAWQINAFLTIFYIVTAVALTLFNSETIMVPFVGGVIILYALYRVVQLIRQKEKTLTVRLYMIEIAGQVIIGGIFIYTVLIASNPLDVWFGYLLGGLLIVRGTLYFYSTRVQDQTEDLATFFIHIAALIVGTYLIIQGTFTAQVMSGIIITIALKRALKTGYDAYRAKQNPKEVKPALTQDLQSIEWQESKDK